MAATCSAWSSGPTISKRPLLLYVTVATGSGSGRCAAASSAAILGLALEASRLQPPVSRILTNLMTETAPTVCSASSANKRFSWVQAITTSSPDWMAFWKEAASRRHKAECCVSDSLRASPSAWLLSGMVWLQSQISVGMVFLAGAFGHKAR